jgi:SAM-dependent methyltransferase
MTAEDRVRWDRVYRADEARPYPAPDPLLFEAVPPPTSDTARALDFAGGVGQNGLWLAEHGYAVDIVDVSRVALNRARSEMAIRNLRRVNLLPLDVDTLVDESSLPHEGYEVVAVFRYLKRDLFPVLATAVKPGGRLIYETFNRRYLQVVPQFNLQFLLEDGELPTAFPNWQVLHYSEQDHRTQFVAVKPAAI